MIEKSLAVISRRNKRANIALANDFRNRFRLERSFERASLKTKTKLLEDRDRTLKALVLRSKQQEKDKEGKVGGALTLLGGGVLGRKFLGRGKIPKLPTQGGAFLSRVGKVGKFGKIGPLAILGTGLDFAGRRAEGQTNLQAGIGAGGGLAGALAGAKYGAILGTAIGGPVGTLIGGVGGSIIGSLAGGRLADLFTGADKRRKFEEKRVEIATTRSLFSFALDDLDSILDKLENLSLFNLQRKEEDDPSLPARRFPFGSFFRKPTEPKTPFFQRPSVQITGLALALVAALALGGPTGEEIPIGAGLLAAMNKTKLGAFIIKKSPFLTRFAKKATPLIDDVIQTPISKKGLEIRADKILRDLGVTIKKEVGKFKITKGRTKIKNKKTLQNQDKVTFSDTPEGSTIIKPKPGELERTLKLIDKINKRMNKNINSRKKRNFIQKNLFKNLKSDSGTSGGTPIASLEDENNNNNTIALAPTNNIFIIQQGDSTTQPPIVSGDSTIVLGGNVSNPLDAMYKYAEMTALQTA